MSNRRSHRSNSPRLLILVCLTALIGAFTVASPLAAYAHGPLASASRAVPRSLSIAAAHTTAVDRTLVADAKALKGCLAKNPAKCANARQAVQQAGSSLAAARRQLAAAARATGSTHDAKSSRRASTLTAPRLSSAAGTLSWQRVDGIKSYVVESKVPGQATQYAVIDAITYRPPPVPGTTVAYRVRTAINRSSWSTPASIAFAPASPSGTTPSGTAPSGATGAGTHAETVDTQAAPALSVSGQELSWNRVGSVTTYVLMQQVAGQEAQYSVVSATSLTPTAVPGATVHYSVRTAVDGSAWSAEVSITFPAVKPTAPPTTPKAPTTTPVTETTSPAPSSPATPGSFELGLVPGSLASTEPGLIHGLGAHSVRMETPIGHVPSWFESRFEEYAKVGIRIMPLSTFEGTMPTPEQAKSLGAWAAAYGPGGTFWQGKSYPASTAMTTIEFGNESSYTYQYSDNSPSAVASRAQTYALRFKEAYEAIHAANPNVGLLAQADDGDTGNSIWVENLFKAVPNFGQIVAGWTVHPYGPKWATRIDALISQTQASGASSSIPIYVTEWGVASDNGRCLSNNYEWNDCMTYGEAATALTSTVTGMLARYGSRLRAMYLYQAQDLGASGSSSDREMYFGATQSNGAAKGAYTTAVQSLLSTFA
jgi:hypothetical protein